MRLFDIVGALMVAAWVGVVGNILYNQYATQPLDEASGAAVFREGDSYMLLTREDEEVGYLFESRTELVETEGWLLEYDLMLNVSMLGINQYVRTEIKATVDRSAFLRGFDASIETAGTQFDVQGTVEGTTVKMSMDIAGSTRSQSITLNDPPRLSNSALNELVVNPERLKPGMSWEQEYFDPTTMGMTKMRFEYVRRHQINVYDEVVDAFHFRQTLGGTDLDAYVDEFGEVQLQEFPLRIVGAKVPQALGKSRASAIRVKYEEAQKAGTGESGDAPNLSLEATMDLLRGGDALASVSTPRYRISQIPADVTLQLDSHEQRVTLKKDGIVELDTAQRQEDMPAPTDLEALLASDLRVDADNPAFEKLIAEVPDSMTLRAELIARAVRRSMTAVPEIGIQTASAALQKGQGDCTEYALVLVAALRHFKVPARFVSGVKADEKGQFILHQWVQYWDGGRFIDLDATADAMLPTTAQVQLFTHATPEKPEIVGLIEKLKFEKLPRDGADDAGNAGDAEPSDFN